MKFDDLDDKMRVFETALDLCVLPGIFMVARLDGRSFTRLTKEVHKFEAPFVERAYRESKLPEAPVGAGALHELLVRLRLSCW